MATFTYPNQSEVAAVKKLSRAERDDLKQRINRADPATIFQTKGESHKADIRRIICPFCGNGGGDDGTPVEVTLKGDSWLYHCFKCTEFSGDLLKIIATDLKLNLGEHGGEGMNQALAAGAALIGYPLGGSAPRPKPILKPAVQVAATPKKKERDPAEIEMIRADIADAQNNLRDLDESQRRGLKGKTLTHFRCGYLRRWEPPKRRLAGKKTPPSERLIVPAGDHYLAAATKDERRRTDKKYWKQHAGTKELFNPAALNADLVVVVEGEIDCMSIWQASEGKIAACAILGANAWQNTLLPRLKNCAAKRFVILLDADDAGKTNSANLRDALIKLGFPAVTRTFYHALKKRLEEQKPVILNFDTKVDANEILQSKGTGMYSGEYGGEMFLGELLTDIIADSTAELDSVEEQIANPPPPATEDNADNVDNAGELAAAAESARQDNLFDRPATAQSNPTAPRRRAADPNQAEEELNADLADALTWLEALTPENFTADDAHDRDNHYRVAVAMATNHAGAAEKFFTVIKKAKDAAKAQLKEADAEQELATPLTDDERSALNALIEGVNIPSLRNAVDRESRDIRKQLKKIAEQKDVIASRKAAQARHERRLQQQAEQSAALDGLRAEYKENPSPELADQMRRLIRKTCDWQYNKFGTPLYIKSTQKNADLIFTYDPYLDGLFGYDTFRDELVLLKNPPWERAEERSREWCDFDDDQLQCYTRGHYEEFGTGNSIKINVTKYAEKHKFNEVKDYFRSLPAWDGAPRAETFFIDWLKVPDTDFAREVTRKWLLAAVARIFHPGCPFQWSLVLHGNQKAGKSYSLEMLGGKWYTALSDNIDDITRIGATLKTTWIGEFKELAAVRKADSNKAKSILEPAVDKYRPVYAKRSVTIPRHCVLASTVNDDAFLGDLTGNRRYLILHSPLPKFGYVKEVRGERLTDETVAQIWAEVYALYKELFKDGFDASKLNLSSAAEFKGEEIAEGYVNDGGLPGTIKNFLDRKILPDVIWRLMTAEEHRAFYAQSNFEVAIDELRARWETQTTQQYRNKHSDEWYHATDANAPHGGVMTFKKFDREYYSFHGTVLRTRVCAVEIQREAFALSDRAASPTKIAEILAHLEGWHLGERDKKYLPYGDQKKIYCRDEDNLPADADDEPAEATPHESSSNIRDSEQSPQPPANADDVYAGDRYAPPEKPYWEDDDDEDDLPI